MQGPCSLAGGLHLSPGIGEFGCAPHDGVKAYIAKRTGCVSGPWPHRGLLLVTAMVAS